jgi:hypothetical protein
MARVLRPGGRLAILDIRHTAQYAAVLRQLGWPEVSRSGQGVLGLVALLLTFGSLRPGEVLARKPETSNPG